MANGTRAANGRSSIYQGADGRWHGFVSVGTKSDGSPDRRHVAGRTRTDVSRKVDELERRRAAGATTRPGKSPTVASAADEFLAACRLRQLKPNTIVGYESALRVHVVPVIGAKRIDAVRPADIDAVFTRMLDGGALRSTPAVRRVLSAMFRRLVKRGELARSPVDAADAPDVDAFQPADLTVAEARALLVAAQSQPGGGAMWVVSLSLGMRKGELLGLRWSDVDLDGAELRIGSTLTRRTWEHGCADEPCGRKRGADCPARSGGGLVLAAPKSDAGTRTVSLPAPLVEALRAHRLWQLETRLQAGALWRDSGAVFAGPVGGFMDPGVAHRGWKSLLREAGVREARLHDARHLAATMLLIQGVDSRVVMEVMGWSQAAMLKRYQHVPRQLRDAASDATAQLLFGP